jgi:ribosomal protein L10
MEGMRRKLPANTSMVVAKNRLLRVAVDNLGDDMKGRWEGLRCQKGETAYVFAAEEDIRGAVKAYSDLLKTLKVRFRYCELHEFIRPCDVFVAKPCVFWGCRCLKHT